MPRHDPGHQPPELRSSFFDSGSDFVTVSNVSPVRQPFGRPITHALLAHSASRQNYFHNTWKTVSSSLFLELRSQKS